MKLDCVFYYVSDLDRAVAFYSTTLGLALTSRDVVARFDVDGLLFELVPTEDLARRSGAGNARLTFAVSDIRAAVADLRSKGVWVCEIQEVANGWLAAFEDPDGNELVLWQYAVSAASANGETYGPEAAPDRPAGFPQFVRDLPEADVPFRGLRGWLLQGEAGQVLFNESDVELAVPAHTHGAQWGVVVDGRIDLTIGDQTRAYTRGQTFFIPAGVRHEARIHPGYRAVDLFADRDRYASRRRAE